MIEWRFQNLLLRVVLKLSFDFCSNKSRNLTSTAESKCLNLCIYSKANMGIFSKYTIDTIQLTNYAATKECIIACIINSKIRI